MNVKQARLFTVDPKNYSENVQVTKTLTIRSASGSPADTVILGNININADDVTINGFTVNGRVSLSGVESCAIKDNIVNSDLYEGIWLSESSGNNTLDSNVASYNVKVGIYMTSGCDNNMITGNTAKDNTQRGIYLEGANNNNLAGNMVINNGRGKYGDGGLFILRCSNNLFYNNYLDNTMNIGYYDGDNNRWNITKKSGTNICGRDLYLGGNYWSDYGGNDTDGDGLGDTEIPYTGRKITDGGDYHPLVEAEFALTITSYTPESTVYDTEGAIRTFDLTTNQQANISWQIDENEEQTNKNVEISPYTADARIGKSSISAIASNQNGTVIQTWIW